MLPPLQFNATHNVGRVILTAALVVMAGNIQIASADTPGLAKSQKPNKSPAIKPTPTAANIEDVVQKLLKTVKKPIQSAPVDERDFIDTGMMEGADMLEGGLEIGGMLTDETVTRFGHDLFEAFNRSWRPPEGASYNIIFGERNDASRGSVITVRLNDTLIYEGFLTPREEAINELGKGLAKDIRNLVRNNANLESEEFY